MGGFEEAKKWRQNMKNVLGVLTMLMEQSRGNFDSDEAIKALRSVVDKIGRYDEKYIINFLRMYVCKMEVHQLQENRMMQTFHFAVVPKI